MRRIALQIDRRLHGCACWRAPHPRHVVEACRDDGDLHASRERRIDDGAEDDVRFFVRGLLDDRERSPQRGWEVDIDTKNGKVVRFLSYLPIQPTRS